MISYHLVRAQDASNYAKGFKEADTNDVERLKRAITEFVWSPCVWRDGVRREENYLRADWCVLDFDDGEMTLDEAKEVFCDTVHIIGTTRSHRKEKGGRISDRFRVAILFSSPIVNLRNYRYTMARVISRYPVDRQPKDGARFFFPCTEIIQASAEGYKEDALKAPATFERRNWERVDLYRRTGVIPPKVRAALTNPVAVGERNTTWFWVAKDLGRIGYGEEDIAVMIVKSRTYEGRVTPDLAREIECCVGNGVKSALRELNCGRNEDKECYQPQ